MEAAESVKIGYRGRIAFKAAVFLGFVVLYALSWGFRDVARWFPQYSSAAGALVVSVTLLRDLADQHRFVISESVILDDNLLLSDESSAERSKLAGPARPGFWFVWLLLYGLLLLLAGGMVGSIAWFVLVMRFASGSSWLRAAGLAVGLTTLLTAVRIGLGLDFPEGLLW